MPKTVSELLIENRAEAEKVGVRVLEILHAAEADSKRSLTEDETSEFDKLVSRQESLSKQEMSLQREELRLEDTERRDEAIAAAQRQYGTAHIVSEPSVYTPRSAANHGPSYFRDLVRAKRGDGQAIERLRKNDAHVETYKAREDRAISTGNGAGGEFVPPLWLENEYVPLARAGRVTADLCTKDDLPAGTDSINIPKVATGTAVGVQGTPTGGQNVAVTQTDLTTTSISSGVYTAAGGQTVSMQLIEQSPVNIDKVVLTDLALANAINTDAWVLNGAGGSTAPQGLLSLTGTNSVAITATTPTTPPPLVGLTSAGVTYSQSLYSAIASAISQVQRKRFLPPTHIVMSPQMWYWILTQADSQNRPVVLDNSNGLFNAAGIRDGLASQGIVGNILGLPVVADPNMPLINTTQSPIIVGRFPDAWLWEGSLKAEAFEQTFAQNLSLFLRLYQYVSFQGARYPQSFSIISGNAMIAPAGF